MQYSDVVKQNFSTIITQHKYLCDIIEESGQQCTGLQVDHCMNDNISQLG